MSVGFDGVTEAINQSLDIPSLNNVSGASITCWHVTDSVPPGPAPDLDKTCLAASSIGPPPGTSNTSRIEAELQCPDGVVANAFYNIVSHILDGDPSTTISTPTGLVVLGKATHIAITANYTTRQAKIYVNGVLQVQGTLVNSTAGNTSATNGKCGSIAAEDSCGPILPVNAGEFFDGRIEDVRIYSKELTPEEVMTIFSCQGVDGIVFGLQQRYELQDNSPLVNVNDSSPADSAQQQLNGHVPPDNGTPAYRESITPTYRRRFA